jgi:carbamate kinase
VSFDEQGHLHGVEAVIDKDLASGLLSKQLDADAFIMLTDVPEVCVDFGTPEQRSIRRAHPDALLEMDFAAGSMGPKVLGACEFVQSTGKMAAIGRLSDLADILAGKAGTLVTLEANGIEYA